jgi:glycosyltransferase involved in cell wall biosynthesis
MSIEITLPAYNEEEILEKNIKILFSFLKKVNFKYNVTIADNGSTDKTVEIAKKLSKKYPALQLLHLNTPGKGNAIKQSWKKSKADLLCFMDADLSTDLNHLNEMVHFLKDYDLVIGNRLSSKSKTERSLSRTILSIVYNTIAKLYLGIKTHDLQCGFKGIKRKVFLALEKHTKNNNFFFDTELIAWAEKKKYKIKEIPIKWIERKASKVNITSTSKSYLRELGRLRNRLNRPKIS